MPIYEYRCEDCGATFEAFQKMSDDPLVECEKCGGPLRKVLHPVAIHFKGSGFYTTDYGKGSGRRTAGKDAGSPESSSGTARARRYGRARPAPARARPATAVPPRATRSRARARPRRRRRRPDSPGGEPRGATDRRGAAQGADHPARAGQRRAHAAAVAQPRRRLHPPRAREVGPGGSPVREPLALRPSRTRLRLAYRRRDPRRRGGQPRGHGGRDAPAPRRGQRLHAHRRRVHRAALAAAVRRGDRRRRPRGGDAEGLRAAPVAASQRPRPRRVRPRASFGGLGRPGRGRDSHLRAEPAARAGAGDAGGGGAGRALRPGPRGHAGGLRLPWRPRAAVRACRGPGPAGGDRLPQQRARSLLLTAQAAGRAARRGAPLPGARLVRCGRPGDHGVGGGRPRAGRPAVPRLRRR